MKKREAVKLPKMPSKSVSCYVLITCEEPLEDGEMPVKMTYQGDETLISYLLQGAQTHFEQLEENEIPNYSTPALRLVE